MSVDFPVLLVALVVLTGVIWLVDSVFFAPRRRLSGEEAPGEGEALVVRRPPKPRLVEYARSFFPVFLIVLLLRSFVVEPFRIPSGSMMPTLLIGDFILVNKFDYGIRLPVIDKKVIDIGAPKRGDVVVFRYPENPSIPFIKRVIGLPGDTISYYDNRLYVNGKLVEEVPDGIYRGFWSGQNMTGANLYTEHLGKLRHSILIEPGYPTAEGTWKVPPHSYFVMGDNRDNSRDSRYWGFVPDKDLIGRAFLIWFNWDWGYGIDWGRIGTSIG